MAGAPAGMPMIDTFIDKGIWAVLDSGCNTTCQGEVWAPNAQKKLPDLGGMPRFDEPGKRFPGLMSSTRSHGMRAFPA